MNPIFIKYKNKAHDIGNVYVFNFEDSISFIEDCCENGGIELYGIDGFFIHSDGRIQPSMTNSIDCSKFDDLESQYKVGLNFLREQPKDMFFEIVTNP